MLQIRLNKGPSLDGGSGPIRSAPPVETVTVACPEHLVIADLPVAKSVGAITASAVSTGRNMGRRSRRQVGDRIHFCVRCDFPIAIYGRLIPCEHAFCLACARSDSSCYLCEERVQKIQTVKMLEGIFICAAPHCLKSFLKKAEFESHVHETHADLLQPNTEKEGAGETNNFNITRPSSADLQKQQSSLPEASTARAPARPGFSPSSNSQPQEREDRSYRHSTKDQTHPRPLPPLRPPPFPSSQPHLTGDNQPESSGHRSYDRPYNWFNNPEMDRAPPEPAFPNFGAQPNYSFPVNPNQPLIPPPFNYSVFDGSQPFFGAPPYEMPPRPESTPSEGISEQGSVLGLPPAPPILAGFRDNYPRPWGMDLMGFANPGDLQGGMPFFQVDFNQNVTLNHLPGKETELQGGSGNLSDGKGMAPFPGKMPLPPPPPPLPPPLSHQINRGRFPGSGNDAIREGQGIIGWQNEKGRFGNWTD